MTTAYQLLEKRAASGLAWISRNLDHFAPIAKLETTPRVKPFAELSILYERLRSVKSKDLGENLHLPYHLRKWRRFLIEHCESRAYAELARRIPSYSYAILLPYLALRTTGYRSSYHEQSIQQSWSTGRLFSVEVVPHRLLDREYFLWKAGLLDRAPEWLKLYANTSLAAMSEVLHIDKEAAYAITHTLFYLSDWGRKILPFDLAEAARVTSIVDSLIVHYWRLSHWDLLSELLANRLSLRAQQSVLERGASAALLNAYRLDGCIPGEGRVIEALAKAPPSEHSSIIFGECYHTTLVGLLYCVTALESRGHTVGR